MGAATSIEMKKMYGEEDSGGDGQDELNSPGGIAVETLINIRTVAALTLEQQRYIDYEKALDRDGTNYVKEGFLSGLSSGFSMGIQQWVNALQLWFGGWILFQNPGVYTCKYERGGLCQNFLDCCSHFTSLFRITSERFFDQYVQSAVRFVRSRCSLSRYFR